MAVKTCEYCGLNRPINFKPCGCEEEKIAWGEIHDCESFGGRHKEGHQICNHYGVVPLCPFTAKGQNLCPIYKMYQKGVK